MKIYIKGFKSIRDGQNIAIGRKLTFLVGPNSAGKSVVMLALQKLKGDSPKFALDETQIYRNPNKDSEICAVHSLGVEWENNSETLGYYATYCSENVDFDQSKSANPLHLHEINDAMSFDDFKDGSTRFCTSHLINGRAVLTAYDITKPGEEEIVKRRKIRFPYGPSRDTIVIELKLVESILRKRLENSFNWLIFTLDSFSNMKEAISDTRNKYKNVKNIQDLANALKSLLDQNIIEWSAEDFHIILSGIASGKDRQRILNIFEKHNAAIVKFRRNVDKKFISGYPGKMFDVSLVSAGRTLPEKNDLFAHVNFGSSDNLFHKLMISHIEEEWPKSHTAEIQLFESQNINLLELVNKALSENLFIDNAYHIKVDSKMLVSKKEWELHQMDEDEDTEYICKIYLMDSHGRMLNFEDVGSGIGYVLPVLIESFDRANEGKIVFLQQPELHLHPALQASLTDVLIEASSNKKIIAETHSEHMILRALKRVRQTANGTLKDQELKLAADDIAVNYFEPLPDGSTKVHILRVSDDGDFLDRWPNGFFAERDQELFDE